MKAGEAVLVSKGCWHSQQRMVVVVFVYAALFVLILFECCKKKNIDKSNVGDEQTFAAPSFWVARLSMRFPSF